MIFAEDLSKQFGDFWAVDGIHLDVRPGQVLALLGQNGAGKTTTVRMLTSVLSPTRGSAVIAGYDVIKQPNQVRASVGVLTEHHGLYLRMTGEEYLNFYGRIYGIEQSKKTKRISDLLEYFGLAAAGRQRIGEYSKGMRQKLALARTLIHEPPVLLLDEPTSAMDPESARLVRASIGNLRSSQRTIIICTHNLVEAELLADHVAIIFKGRLLVYGTLQELKQRVLGSAHYEVQLRNRDFSWRLELPEGVKIIKKTRTSATFSIKDPFHTNPDLINRLISMGAEVVSIHEIPRTLEEVYLATMVQVGHA